MGWKWGEHKIRDAECHEDAAVPLPCPRLLHLPGAVLAPRRPSAGRGSRPGGCEALPTNLQGRQRQPCAPQLPASASAKGESSLLLPFFFFFRKPDSTWPNPQLTVHRAQGRDCSQEEAGRGAERSGAGSWLGSWGRRQRRPGRDWLARAAGLRLSCQPRAEAGLRPGLPAACTHPPARPACTVLAKGALGACPPRPWALEKANQRPGEFREEVLLVPA